VRLDHEVGAPALFAPEGVPPGERAEGLGEVGVGETGFAAAVEDAQARNAGGLGPEDELKEGVAVGGRIADEPEGRIQGGDTGGRTGGMGGKGFGIAVGLGEPDGHVEGAAQAAELDGVEVVAGGEGEGFVEGEFDAAEGGEAAGVGTGHGVGGGCRREGANHSPALAATDF